MPCFICSHDLTVRTESNYVIYECNNCNLFKETFRLDTVEMYYEIDGRRVDQTNLEECKNAIITTREKYRKENSIPNGFHEVCRLDGNIVRYFVNVEGDLEEFDHTIDIPDVIEPRRDWTKEDFYQYRKQLLYALHDSFDQPKDEKDKMQRWLDLCILFGMNYKNK